MCRSWTGEGALHDDDESLGKQLRVVRGSQTQTRRFCCMVVASVQFIVWNDTKLEGEEDMKTFF